MENPVVKTKQIAAKTENHIFLSVSLSFPYHRLKFLVVLSIYTLVYDEKIVLNPIL